LLFSILRKYPNIKKGHLFDLPSVVKGVVVPDDLKERVEVHGGSFLDAETGIPAGADAYIMKHIIHDWDDEKVRMHARNLTARTYACMYVYARCTHDVEVLSRERSWWVYTSRR
jgi:hypothetical protein